MGTRYARFASFVRGPASVLAYLRALLKGTPEHHIGHNPAGSVAIVLMLLSGAALVATGWATYNDWGGEWLGELHEGAANLMLGLVGVHVIGVVVASYLHHENLARAMVTGYKQGLPDRGIGRAWYFVALLMVVAVLVFWWWQWQGAPPAIAGVMHAYFAG